MKKSIIIRIAIVLVGMLVVVLGRGLFFYSGVYSPPPSEEPSYEYVVVPTAFSTEFIDVYEEGEGVILIDLAHNNAFNKEELNVLILRLVSRGLTVRFLSTEDDLTSELLGESEEEEDLKEESLDEEEDLEERPLADEEEKLTGANAFIIVCPQSEFSKGEIDTIDEFISNGGKMLLIADPTRPNQINSVSIKFGLIFEPDYLYNMKENEINYRNIFITEFEDNEVTKNLEKIILYTAGSISSANNGIAFVDEDTFSSMIETRTRLSPVALAQESKILAVYDLTFMSEPYNGILDNNQLISNVADWLISPAEEAESR